MNEGGFETVSDAGRPAISQRGINRLRLLEWWLMPASICMTTCCTTNVTLRWKQIDLGNVCERVSVCARTDRHHLYKQLPSQTALTDHGQR